MIRTRPHIFVNIGARAQTTQGAPCGRCAFTLVELLVVIAVILLALSVVGPGISAMWNQRRESQSETVVSGAIRSVQVQARTRGERGLFFYVDANGDQRIAFIAKTQAVQDSRHSAVIEQPNTLVDCFTVTDERIYRLPTPFRAAPLGALDPVEWDDEEMGSDSVWNTEDPTNQRHRNFFSVIFGPDGRLRIGRNVLIHDPTNHTGLGPSGEVEAYYDDSDPPQAQAFPAYYREVGSTVPPTYELTEAALDGMIATSVNGDLVALNFPSVSGVLVYDHSVMTDIPKPAVAGPNELDQREWLARSAAPYYINRVTGELVRGPTGE